MRSAPLLLTLVLASPLFAVDAARAQVACAPGSFTAATSTFQVDANGNGAWDGDAGGDRTTQVAVELGAGQPLVGDWNGDGYDDVGVVVGDTFAIDLDGDGVWEGAAGGDRVTRFAVSFGPGKPIVGDWNGDGRDDIGVFVASGRFLLDANGDGVWNGKTNGDANVLLGLQGLLVDQVPVVVDWNLDGLDDVGWAWNGLVRLDANGNRIWEGNAGGDRSNHNFFVTFVGRFDLAEPPVFGFFMPADSRLFVDRSNNLAVNRPPGVDVLTRFAAFTGIGELLVCDWNGDGEAEVAKLVGGTRYQVDFDGNFKWLGPTAGDVAFEFDVGAPALPVPARWKSP